MLDLKTIKEIRISEGSVTKITDSSGVVLWQKETGTTAQTPCYYVAKNVSDLPSTPKYDMAYITSEKRWYVLNNKSQWEKYGVIEFVSSLDNVTAYNGKLVYNTTDKHQYKYTNNAWTDQGEVSESVVKNYWAECKQDQIELYHITYHWGEGYHIEFESAYNSTSSINYKVFVHCQFDNSTRTDGPIEIGEGTDSYYYDQHYPTSTTSNACDTSDNSNRTWIYSAHNANTRYRLKVWNDKIEQHKYDDDSLVTSSTVSWTTHSWYNGLYEMGLHTANSNLIWHAARFYDSDNNLTDEWLVQSDGSIKETLTQTVVQPQSVATGVTVSEYDMTTYTYPTNYEQYDSPNLNFTECANEAAMKTLSCPYEGMKVKLTDTGKRYKFTYNSTTSQYEWDEITPSLDVDLNNQWIASTKTLDGYKVYMSNSNKGVNNGYASMKFKFEGMPDFKIWINSYAESCCDYTVAWNIDVDFPTSNPSNGSTGVKAHTQYHANNPTGITAFTEVDYPNDGGEHFVVVTYRKDYSVNSNDDRGYVAVKLTLLSTTWVVSSTEFIKKDDKYYEKLTEVGTYEGGITALTGNYKEGNELAVTYHQGSADDYIIVGSSKYYKKYAYVTPVNTEINTGDYIQGDYIGEVTPSMKVTYVDNTEKTFYNLTSIEKDTDPNKANAKSVEVYDSVTSIGNQAFRFCSSLTGITIPDSVTTIQDRAFGNCSSLTGITIPNSVTSIGIAAFGGCSSLTSITIPDSVKSIGDNAFGGCSSLTSITIPDSVKSIGDNAFQNCSSLTSITLPNSVTSIGNYVFWGCSSLTGITIPNSVTSIGDYAFYNCSSLTSIIIPDSVTAIGKTAFYGCSKLSAVTIRNSSNKIAYNTDAFGEIASSAKLYVPSNLLSQYQADSSWTGAFKGGIFAIGEQVITNAMKVESRYGTDIFTGLTSISSNIIDEDDKADVDYITIYYGVTSIGDYAFQYFISLMDVRSISYSVKTIGEGAFWGCSYLDDITLPYYVTSIGKWAFSGCSHLKYITIQASTPPSLGDDAIPSNVTTIYVPASSVNAYKSATNWSAFASKIKAIGT